MRLNFVITAMLALSTAAWAEVNSGPKVGDKLPALPVYAVTGEPKAKDLDYARERGSGAGGVPMPWGQGPAPPRHWRRAEKSCEMMKATEGAVMNTFSLYPLRFAPIFKDYLWGGRQMAECFPNAPATGPIAEAWLV